MPSRVLYPALAMLVVYLCAISIALLALASFPRKTILVACLEMSLALLVLLVQLSSYYPLALPLAALAARLAEALI